MLTVGVDLVDIERIRQTVERFGDRFTSRVFTADELAAANGRPASLAARFAAKEAAAKALGWGIGQIAWRDIEVVSDDRGKPALRLHGPAGERARTLGIAELALSLAHERALAIAFVVGA